MTSLKNLSIDLRSGPLVAAMGALAAGTLVAATMLGHSLGPIPADNPAIAILPGTGVGAPLVLNVNEARPNAGSALDPSTITAATALGQNDDAFPPRADAQQPITSLTEEETTEPAPPQDGAIERVQRVVADIVNSVTNEVHPRGKSGDKRALGKAKRAFTKRAAPAVAIGSGVGAIDVQPAFQVPSPAAEAIAATGTLEASAPGSKESDAAPAPTASAVGQAAGLDK